MICLECGKPSDKGEMVGLCKGHKGFFCSKCAKKLFKRILTNKEADKK